MWLLIGALLLGVAVIVAVAVNSINSNTNENRAMLARNQQKILDRLGRIERISEKLNEVKKLLVKEYSFDEDGALDVLQREVKQIKALQYKILPEALMAAEMGKRFYIHHENAERYAADTNENVRELLGQEAYWNTIPDSEMEIGIKSIGDSLDWAVTKIKKEVEGE
ncbi:TPA: hypothetical protein ACGPMP_004381 [Enterobacter roggenkampii]|uniref:hypothetical protein n=1 Tax=Enterobacter roggenkampii TaxID=1812935 RepID=UPI0035D3F57D